MSDLSSASVAIYDSGLFVHISQCLSEQFGKVYYYSPCEGVMPKLCHAIVGDGFENIERIDHPISLIGKVDCWCFTDIGASGFQKYLRSIGENVWGHMGADELEVSKGKFLETLKSLGMEIAPFTTVVGVTALKDYLQDIEDVYIKISRYRGDLETFHFRTWALDESVLDCVAYRFGAAKDLIKFYIFDAIDTPIEDGVDSWFIDGQWPKRVLHAIEKKDKSLIGGIQDFSDVAEPVREVNEKFGPVLAEYGYRGAFSTEIRLNDKTYFIDPSTRFGSPPSQLQTVLIKNLPEIIYEGSRGNMVEPESPELIGAQVLITSDREKDEWLTFDMPDELRPFVKSAFACEIDGILRIAPNPLENWAGWLVATGNSIESVVEELKRLKAMLPDGFECDLSSLSDLIRELHEAKDEGITVTQKPVPEPRIVLDKSK